MIIGPLTGNRGCDHCTGPVMTVVHSPAGLVELCWDCTIRFTGWTAEHLESVHSPDRDHLLDAFERGVEADAADTWEWLRS